MIGIVEFLLQQGFSPNQAIQLDSIEQPALCLATRLNQCQAVGALLRFGAQTNVWDTQKQTPLHLAAKADCPLCIKVIFEFLGRRDE